MVVDVMNTLDMLCFTLYVCLFLQSLIGCSVAAVLCFQKTNDIGNAGELTRVNIIYNNYNTIASANM